MCPSVRQYVCRFVAIFRVSELVSTTNASDTDDFRTLIGSFSPVSILFFHTQNDGQLKIGVGVINDFVFTLTFNTLSFFYH